VEASAGKRRKVADSMGQAAITVRERALLTQGASSEAIYPLAAAAIAERAEGSVLIDVGCGQGLLRKNLTARLQKYIGVDLVRYPGFPADSDFCCADLNGAAIPLPDGSADVVACVETIEHVENPRALMRELVRLARPGGLIVLTTPNQLSLLSKLTLIVKGRFNAFTETSPGPISALLESDLVSIARECGLTDIAVRYTDSGRIPGTARHWPRCFGGRAFSDNILLIARCRSV